MEAKQGWVKYSCYLGLGAGDRWLARLSYCVALQTEVAAQRGKSYADAKREGKKGLKSHVLFCTVVHWNLDGYASAERWFVCDVCSISSLGYK